MHPSREALSQPVLATVLAISGGRLGSVVGIVLALAGTAAGGTALVRSTRRSPDVGGAGDAPGGAAVAVGLGLTATVFGLVVVATSDGGVGTGNGRGGAFVAVVLGLVGMVLGGIARARTRGVA